MTLCQRHNTKGTPLPSGGSGFSLQMKQRFKQLVLLVAGLPLLVRTSSFRRDRCTGVCVPSGGIELSLQVGKLLAQLFLLVAGLLQVLAHCRLPEAGLHVALGPRLQLLHLAVLSLQGCLYTINPLLQRLALALHIHRPSGSGNDQMSCASKGACQTGFRGAWPTLAASLPGCPAGSGRLYTINPLLQQLALALHNNRLMGEEIFKRAAARPYALQTV